MMHESEIDDPLDSAVSNRTMNIVVAIAMMAVAAVVMVSCYRLGAGWAKDVGPDSGYFPFYIALFMFCASGITLVQQLMLRGHAQGGSFIAHGELAMVLKVLIPMSVFVVMAIYIGIYISTTLFIMFFMMWIGRYSLVKTLPIAILVPIALFIVFEVWFLVPLPKGPVEAWLGY